MTLLFWAFGREKAKIRPFRRPAAARQGMSFPPLILILPRLFGLTGVQVTQAAADALALLCAIPIQARALRRMGRG